MNGGPARRVPSGAPTVIAIAGMLLSVAVGAAVGLGHERAVIAGAFGIAALALVWNLGARLTLAPGKLGHWLLAGAFFAMPLNAFRVAGSVTVGDFLLLAAIPFALVAVIARDDIPRLPAWLYAGGFLLISSILLVEVFPPGWREQVFLTPTTLLQEQSDIEDSSSLLSGIRLLIALLFLPVVTCFLADGWRKIRLLTDAWLAGVALSCAVAVLGAAAGIDPLGSLAGFPLLGEGLYQGTRAAGLSVHPVTLALTAVMAAPVVLTRITDRRSGLVYGPVFGLILLAILLSGTRSGLLVLLFICAVVMAVNPRTRRLLAGVLLAGAAAICVLLLASIPGTERFQGGDASAGASNQARLNLYEESVSYIADRPLTGYGFELIRDSHSLVLQLLLAGGLIGLIGYFTVFVGYLTIGWRSRLRVPDWIRPDAVGLTLALVAFLAAGLVGNDVYARYLYIPAGLLLAMSVLGQREPVDKR